MLLQSFTSVYYLVIICVAFATSVVKSATRENGRTTEGSDCLSFPAWIELIEMVTVHGLALHHRIDHLASPLTEDSPSAN